jgi:hypothetical protein
MGYAGELDYLIKTTEVVDTPQKTFVVCFQEDNLEERGPEYALRQRYFPPQT